MSEENAAKLDELDTEQVAPPGASQTVVTGGELAGDDSMPANVGDARVDDGGVRTNSATEPIADALGTGAGAHVPPPANVGPDGREQFVDDVAPTALATYDGPCAPPGQGEAQVEAAQYDEADGPPEPPAEVSHDDPEVKALVEAHDGDELAGLAEDRGLKSSGTKPEVAARIVQHDRANA